VPKISKNANAVKRKRNAATRFGRSVRAVPIKPSYPCTSLKRHFTAKLYQWMGYAEFQAARDPERFVWAGMTDFANHMGRAQQDPATLRHAKFCKAYARQIKIVGPQVTRVRKGRLHSGFILAEHDSIFGPHGTLCDFLADNPACNSACNIPYNIHVGSPVGSLASDSGSPVGSLLGSPVGSLGTSENQKDWFTGWFTGHSPQQPETQSVIDINPDASTENLRAGTTPSSCPSPLALKISPLNPSQQRDSLEINRQLDDEKPSKKPNQNPEQNPSSSEDQTATSKSETWTDYQCHFCLQTVPVSDYINDVHMCQQRAASLQSDRDIQGRRKRGVR
jgi:hypothetical protein